ncbi:hypothetical protein EPN90_02165 [Patescibacteria group bacterium]|nr:MAG: hypothetical protein EPN90_02165 [Patescibacteria group bacterium]
MSLRVPPSREHYWEEESQAPAAEFLTAEVPRFGTSTKKGRHAAAPALHLSLYRKIATLFVAVSLLLLFFVLYISFARAKVTIVPRVEKVSATATIVLSAEPKTAEGVTGYALETVVDGAKTVTLKGGANAKIVAGTACGEVSIINNQSRVQQLVERTRLLSKDGTLFRIKKSVSVPAGGKIEVEACADQPGKSGDIGPTTFNIPGLSESLQKLTYAESKTAMSGGQRTIAVVSQADVDQAITALSDELAAAGVDKLKKMVPSTESAKGSFTTSNVVKKETDAKVGSELSSFKISLSLHVVGVFYDPMALGQAAGAALRSSLGSGKELTSVDTASLEAKLVSADPAAKQAKVEVKLSGSAELVGGDLLDKGKIAGLSAADANKYLRSQNWVESAEIKLSPFWTRKVPKILDHIDVEIKPVGR